LPWMSPGARLRSVGEVYDIRDYEHLRPRPLTLAEVWVSLVFWWVPK
jgi:hypothetical protein